MDTPLFPPVLDAAADLDRVAYPGGTPDGAWPEGLEDSADPFVQAGRAYVLLAYTLLAALPFAVAHAVDEPDVTVGVGQSGAEIGSDIIPFHHPWPQDPSGDPVVIDSDGFTLSGTRSASGHMALTQAQHRLALTTATERFLASVQEIVPVLDRAWMSFCVLVYPQKVPRPPQTLTMDLARGYFTLYGKTPALAAKSKIGGTWPPFDSGVLEQARALIHLLRFLAPLRAPTTYWRHHDWPQAVAAASQVEAAYLWETLQDKAPQPLDAWIANRQDRLRVAQISACIHPDASAAAWEQARALAPMPTGDATTS